MRDTSHVLISSVEGNGQWLDGGSMFGNVPKAVWEKWTSVDAKGRIQLACRAMLVETHNTRILCETGIGSYMSPELADRFGIEGEENRLLKSLESLSLKPEDIDFVILSHLHFDHAGGMLPSYQERKEGKKDLVFPKAKIVVGKEAWERAVNPHPRDRASFIPELQDLLLSSGRLLIVEQSTIPGIDPEKIQLRYSSGHTPGHVHTLVRGKQETFFFAGDLVPGKPWVHLPVTMGYDRYPELVIDEKSGLYQEALNGNWNLFFTHDTGFSSAKIQRDDKARFVTREEHVALVRYAI